MVPKLPEGVPSPDPFTDEPITVGGVGSAHRRQASSPQRPGRPSLDTSGIRHRGDFHSRGPSLAGERDNSLSPSASPYMGASLTPGHSPSHSAGASGDFNWNLDGVASSSISPNRSPTAGRSRTTSNVNRDVLDVFDNSAWGESIKRSFTMRRSGTRGGRGQAGPSPRAAQGTVRSMQASRRESPGRERRPSSGRERRPSALNVRPPDPPPPPMPGPGEGNMF